MSNVFKKLNLKDASEILVVDAPDSFGSETEKLAGVTVHRDLGAVAEVGFVLAFVTSQQQLESTAGQVAATAPGDAVVWFAYPKKSSKRNSCDIDRDHGWQVLGELGFEGVRQVAVDDDWSALRFRRVEFIKSMKRDPKRALTRKGRSRTG